MRYLTLLLLCIQLPQFTACSGDSSDFDQLLDSFPVVEEINTSAAAPVHEFPEKNSAVTNILGRPARTLHMGDEAKVMAWVIGRNRDLKPGAAYVLSIEFPDDAPRTFFVANRGADQVRGFATGTATGDVRQQYTQPSLESLAYPHTGKWQRYRSLFVLHHRFQGLRAQRDPQPGGRPFGPQDGFHVILFQSYRLNDPRSQGVAVGRIRLHRVPDLASLAAPGHTLPPGLPRRRIFFREEMGDEPVSGRNPEDRACPDPVEWYLAKARISRALGHSTFTRDLLEFGHNQGWESEDQKWIVNAQPPLTRLWDDLVPRLASLDMDVLPYYEYKGGLGFSDAQPRSLGWQRRAEKLYHGNPNTNYTGIWWVEQHNADLTDPDTLADAKRLIQATILKHKDKAPFAGAWFRTRDNHLPISFSTASLSRFRAAHPGDPAIQTVTRESLVKSCEGDRELYSGYIQWWLQQRQSFLSNLQTYLAGGLGKPASQLIFTPWPSEPVPLLRDPGSGTAGHPVQITTDDPAWWEALAKQQPDSSWFRWALMPTHLDTVIKDRVYASSLAFREPVSPLPWRTEAFHSAPGADPRNYRTSQGVMLSFPIGRLFTVADPQLLSSYRTQAGLTVVRHYPLNEDNPADTSHKGPFGGHVGYVCVDVDRAGPYVCLQEARALAHGDPINIGLLSGSVYSTGFPGHVRRFNRAFLSVPALPSAILADATSDQEIIVRQVNTGKHGSYFYVINTSMQPKHEARVILPGKGPVRDLLSPGLTIPDPLLLSFDPGEVRSFHRAAK